jgi:biofilm PGA synthesis N-glycosyltransferase PgaC
METQHMRATVCIPVHNEEKNISFVIQNILNQKIFGVNLNVIVLSSGSTDNTNEIVRRFCQPSYAVNLIIESQRSGKANAMNLILPFLRESETDVCIFTDGDVYLDKDALKCILERFNQRDELSVITGHPVVSETMKNGIWRKIALENCAIWDGVRKAQANEMATWTLSGYLFAIKTKDLPEKIPIKLAAEDAFLGLSLLLSGKKMEYESNALVYVKYPSNIRDYYRQKSRTRSGWAQIFKSAPEQMRALRSLQRQIIFSRIYQGNYISFLCFILDNLIWVLDYLFTRNNANRHIWQSVDSTK